MKAKSVRDLKVRNKRVLLRVDYNVPISDGVVGDPLRIEGSFATIKYLLSQNCSIVMCSHLGRPDGKPDPKLSLAPVAKKASELLGLPITFIPATVGPEAEAAVKNMRAGEIVLLENLRFHKEEEENNPEFAKQLASFGDVYVDDAFAVIHRAHASTVGVPHYIPGAIGLLVENEVKTITGALERPAKPLIAIVGGAKVSSKIEVLNNLMKYVDRLVIAGAMANTFMAAKGQKIGKSKFEPDFIETANKVMHDAEKNKVELVLPDDVIVSKSVKKGPSHHSLVGEVKDDEFIVDVGPKTVAKALNPLEFHGTVIWNGPLGITEVPAFAHNSLVLAENIIESGADCIIGGGDTAAFIDEAGLHDKFKWVSTGGGASLELMAGNELPGIKVLERR